MDGLDTKQSFATKTVCLVASLVFVYFTVYLFVLFGHKGWDLAKILFQGGMTLITFGAIIYTASPSRFAWGLRLITFVIFLGYFGYLFNQFIIQPSEFSFTVSRASSTPFNALLGFLIIGIPCLMYSLWGSVWGGRKKSSGVEGNSLSFYISFASQWVFLLLSFFSVVYYFL